MLAWDAFEAPDFPYDEALRLARVVGVDLDADVVGRWPRRRAATSMLWDSATARGQGRARAAGWLAAR